MELNGATARLLELVRDNEASSAVQLLQRLEQELGMAPHSLEAFGLEQLQQFAELSVVHCLPS